MIDSFLQWDRPLARYYTVGHEVTSPEDVSNHRMHRSDHCWPIAYKN